MIFRRAIQREFAYTAAGIFVALFAILLTSVLLRLLGQAAGGRVPADAVLALIGFGALTHMSVVLSLTVFIAVLLALSRSYRDSEMVVWFASGLPLTAFIRPVLQFSLPAVILIAALSLFIGPWAYSKSAEYQAQLDARDDTTRVAPGIFRESGSSERVFFVENSGEEIDGSSAGGNEGNLHNVFAARVHNAENAVDVVASATGRTYVDEKGDRFLILEDGRRYEGTAGTPEYRVSEFERYTIFVEARKAPDPLARTRARPTSDLLKIPVERHLGELAERISMPLAALLLVLMAIPLSFVNPRAGRGNNLIFAILLYLVYSNSISIFQAWISQGRIGFVIGLLAPHLMVLALLALMFYHRLTLSPFWRTRAS